MNKVIYKCLSSLLIISFVFSVLISGTSPALAVTNLDLQTAGTYALLAYSGITNTGASIIVGDVGSNPTASITGFPPGLVTGTLHPSADAATGLAKTHLAAAYTSGMGQAVDINLSGQDLGGKTLVEGVYRFDADAGLTGTLILDAAGNPNAVWIFQIVGQLTTASASQVIMANNGYACNVYWLVGSSATLGTTTQFLGNIMAYSSITLNNGAILTGRALAQNGSITLNTNNVSVCAAPCPILTMTTVPAPPMIIGTTGAAYSVTFVASGGAPPYTYTKTPPLVPPGLTLNPATGVLSGVLGAVGSYNFTVTATDVNGCFVAKPYTIIINAGGCPPITLAPTSLPNGIVGTTYNQTITASGSAALPYTYALSVGSLPPTLLLNTTTGVLSGRLTRAGSYTFTIVAYDTNFCASSREYTIQATCPPITISPPPGLPGGSVGVAYNKVFTATGGTAPYTFTVISGRLPLGLTLDSTTGVLSGTPTTLGNFTFSIRATDSLGCFASTITGSDSQTTLTVYTLPINPNPTQQRRTGASESPSVSEAYVWCTRPDRLCVRDAYVQSSEVYANQPVTLFANVVNRCDQPDTYKVTLKVNGIVQETRNVSVGGSMAVPLQFTVTGKEPGMYNLDLNGEKANFLVIGEKNNTSSSSTIPPLVIVLIVGIIILAALIIIRQIRVSDN